MQNSSKMFLVNGIIVGSGQQNQKLYPPHYVFYHSFYHDLAPVLYIKVWDFTFNPYKSTSEGLRQ